MADTVDMLLDSTKILEFYSTCFMSCSATVCLLTNPIGVTIRELSTLIHHIYLKDEFGTELLDYQVRNPGYIQVDERCQLDPSREENIDLEPV